MDRCTRIETLLRAAFAPLALEVIDESAAHRGHAGAADGAGHFRVRLTAERFRGVSRIARHRLVYDALKAELGPEIHALVLDLRGPDDGSF